MGLDKIKSSLAETVANNQLVLESGDIFLQEKNLTSRFVSKQTLKALINEPFDIRIGTEIPFKIRVDDEIVNEWKFSGLKVKGKLKSLKNNLLMSYEAEISSPSGGGISGPKGKSSVRLKEFAPQILFTLSLSGQNTTADGIPLFNEIPLLKSLFQTESTSHHYKMVICILSVEHGV